MWTLLNIVLLILFYTVFWHKNVVTFYNFYLTKTCDKLRSAQFEDRSTISRKRVLCNLWLNGTESDLKEEEISGAGSQLEGAQRVGK